MLGLLMAPSPIPDKPRPTWRQRFGRWLFVLAMGYLGALVLLIWLENKLVYYPAGPRDWQPATHPLVQDAHLTSADGTKLHAWSLPDVGQRIHPYFPVRWLMRNRFDSLSKMPLCTRPTFITHGDADGLVPFDLGVRLYEAAPGPKQFLRISSGDHNGPLPAEFFTQLKTFLDKNAPLPVAAAN